MNQEKKCARYGIVSCKCSYCYNKRLYSEKEHLTTNDNPRTPYTPKETTMTKEQAPKESSNTVVVITWESGMVNVYRKDSKELLEVLIHEHHMIYEVMEAEMIS